MAGSLSWVGKGKARNLAAPSPDFSSRSGDLATRAPLEAKAMNQKLQGFTAGINRRQVVAGALGAVALPIAAPALGPRQ